uniref:Intersectin-2-like n=1 Tax=Saccoglossus kowalevskii TaxID=10224 RepID=A0ABM0LU35_SACKO|nr:PREDICTED: intersectin-2-like [Saccoglossus kowalevskii]
MINQWSKQSHKFRKFLKKQLSELNCSNVGLATYLLAPLQRIPKYVLLLKQLLKYTTEDNPDYYYMQTAVQGLNEFINNMNTAIQEAFKVLNSSTQSPPKKIESSGSHEFSSNSSIDLHKLSHSSTALSTSSHKDSGIHSTVLSIDDLEVDLELLPDDDR